MPGEQMLLLPELFVIVLCVALGLGKRKVGLFCYMLYGSRAQTVHVRQTQQSSYDQTLFESRALAFCIVFVFVLCCFLLFYHYGEIELLDSPHSFIYLVAFQQPK